MAEPGPASEGIVPRVGARAPAELLRPGLVVVDTPRISSVFRHDEAAARAFLEADGTIVVLSADAALSQEERKLLAALSERQAPTFLVLNMVDHLTLSELTRFVTDAVEAELGRKERLWRVSARAALARVTVSNYRGEPDYAKKVGERARVQAGLRREPSGRAGHVRAGHVPEQGT